jgi:hypothetical protein
MYSKKSGLILGFHGCEETISLKAVTLKESLKSSFNDYDWLGHGVYFWEHDTKRALDFAKKLQKSPPKGKNPLQNPSVLGAVIDLGFCLDLTVNKNLKLLKKGYEILKLSAEEFGFEIPKNIKIGKEQDLLLRKLDCAVIEILHQVRKEANLPPFDSVRGVFWEGKELYPNAGFREKNHIQICIINQDCIKGYFLPRN